jgi:small subunit ribosomal protein S9
VARVWLQLGSGTVTVNDRPAADYFGRQVLTTLLGQPLRTTGAEGKFDVQATVDGGGLSGQAGAIRLGIARALVQADAGLKVALRRAGLLTRDPRVKERKKYGQPGARARFQFSKR